MVQSKLVEENGHLKRAILQLETEQTTIVCSMDLHSGANTETFEVTSPTGTYRLENLTHLTIQTEEEYQVKEMGDGRQHWKKEVLPNGYCFHSGHSKTARARVKTRKSL